MTDARHQEALLQLIADYGAANSGSPKRARDALIRTGIYTKKGKLKVAFGGGAAKKG